MRFIETGEPVARQTRRLLTNANLLNERAPKNDAPPEHGTQTAPQATAVMTPESPRIQLLTTGPVEMLQAAAHRWLGLPAQCCESVSVS